MESSNGAVRLVKLSFPDILSCPDIPASAKASPRHHPFPKVHSALRLPFCVAALSSVGRLYRGLSSLPSLSSPAVHCRLHSSPYSPLSSCSCSLYSTALIACYHPVAKSLSLNFQRAHYGKVLSPVGDKLRAGLHFVHMSILPPFLPRPWRGLLRGERASPLRQRSPAQS